MKKYVLINIVLFIVLSLVIYRMVLNNSNELQKTLDDELYSNISEVKLTQANKYIVYFIKNIGANATEIKQLIADYRKYDLSKLGIYVLLAYNNEESCELDNQWVKKIPIIPVQFEAMCKKYEFGKGGTIIYDNKKKRVLKQYKFIVNSLSMVEVLNENTN